MVIFTKSDVLWFKLVESLEEEGLSYEEIGERLRVQGATDIFKQAHKQLIGLKFSPKGYL